MNMILLLGLLLTWDSVTLDVDGNPLSPGNEVKSYSIFGCRSNNCAPGNATFIATVPAVAGPKQQFNIDGLPRPQSYFFTSKNLSGEGGPSNVVRVTPPKSGTIVVEE